MGRVFSIFQMKVSLLMLKTEAVLLVLRTRGMMVKRGRYVAVAEVGGGKGGCST